MGELPTWSETARDHDSALCGVTDLQTVQVIDTSESREAKEEITSSLKRFVASSCPTNKNLLIKTSTTGRRAGSHEVSRDLLEIVLAAVSDVKPSKQIMIGDGPAYSSYIDACHEVGWTEIIARHNVEVVDLNQGSVRELKDGWPISELYCSSGAVINLTKAKTHRRFGVSLAEKALLGVLSGGHLGYPKLANKHDFVPWLLREIVDASPPIYSIIDGIRGIDGEGPLAGQPTESHFVILGTGCLGPDLRAVVEMGFDPVLVPLLCRPMQGFRPRPPQTVWEALRVTSVDFVPASGCAWLYKSLSLSSGAPRRREKKYQKLLEGAKEYYPKVR